MIAQYKKTAEERRMLGIPPLPLSLQQVAEIAGLIEQHHPESGFFKKLLAERVEPGVGKAAKVKAEWLEQVALGTVQVPSLSPLAAITMLGQMGGGYNVAALVPAFLLPLKRTSTDCGTSRGMALVPVKYRQRRRTATAVSAQHGYVTRHWFDRSLRILDQLLLILFCFNLNRMVNMV